MKQPKKVALIDVRDYPRADFDAYHQITVLEPVAPETDWTWRAKIMSYRPLGYSFGGVEYTREQAAAKWPGGVPRPQYPSDDHLLRDKDYQKLSPEDKLAEQAKQDAFRAACAAAHAAAPQPLHLIDEAVDTAATKDAADTAAQEWVREKMKAHRRAKPKPVSGYAIPLPLDPLGDAVRELYEGARYLWRRFARPVLMAIAYSQTIRHSMLAALRDAIDGGAGAGLLRIYDGSRPATCGTATTLGAELTYSDPCAGSPSGGALTFSAITADASANASITASWYRSVDSTGTCCEDGNVGTSGSDLNLNTTTITSGVQVSVSSKVITGGNA